MNVVLSNAPGGLEGSVTSNNRPVPSALMVLSSPAASETPVASALTDPNGRYHLTGFPAGQYVLSIEAPVGEGDEVTRRSQPVDVTNSSTRLDVVLPLAVPVTGTVRLNGKAPRYTDGNVPALMFMPNGGGGNSRHAKLDENGNFAVQVEPGSYSVGLEDRPGADVQVPPAGVQNLQLAY